MSRSGYSTDCDGWELIRWRGAVTSAIRGKRGQAFLRELIEVLDVMPKKSLAAGEFQTENGEVCALGAVAIKRGLNVTEIDPYDREQVACKFGIAEAMAAEIMFQNDEWLARDNAYRWQLMHDWAESWLIKDRP